MKKVKIMIIILFGILLVFWGYKIFFEKEEYSDNSTKVNESINSLNNSLNEELKKVEEEKRREEENKENGYKIPSDDIMEKIDELNNEAGKKRGETLARDTFNTGKSSAVKSTKEPCLGKCW